MFNVAKARAREGGGKTRRVLGNRSPRYGLSCVALKDVDVVDGETNGGVCMRSGLGL